MDDEDEKPTVARNLKALIGEETVNSWARRHGLVQSTINRIVIGKMDPTVGLLNRIAEAVNERGGRLEGWQLMIEGYDPRNAPILLVASAAERHLYERKLIHSDGQQQKGDSWLGKEVTPRRRASDK